MSLSKRSPLVMSSSHRYCGCENVIVRYPRVSIEKGAKKQRKAWIKLVQCTPELQKDYDPVTGCHL